MKPGKPSETGRELVGVEEVFRGTDADGYAIWSPMTDAERELTADEYVAEFHAHVAEAAKREGRKPPSRGLEPTVPLQLRSAVDLFQMEFEQQTFLPMLAQDGYIVKGETHILAASPKTGKTALLFACVMDWVENPNRTVLWFSEEGDRVWNRRLTQAASGMYDKLGYSKHPGADGFIGFNGPLSNLIVLPAMGLGFDAMRSVLLGRDELWKREWAHDTPILQRDSVLIIDTLRLVGIEDENSADLGRAAEPWVEYSQRTGCTLILVHHMRKSGGEHGKGVAGHHSLTGAADNIIEIERDGDGNRRTIKVIGRSVEEAKGTYERVEKLTPQGLGTGLYEFKFTGSRKPVLERIKPLLLREEWLTTTEIREALDPAPLAEAVTNALIALCRDGYAERKPGLGEDVARRTVKWRRRT
jgi:DNA repair protein RadA/Sms